MFTQKMASKTTDANTLCLVCFEPQDDLQTIGQCKHRFCTTCLKRHMEGQKRTGEKISCPTCHTECSLVYDEEGDVTQASGSKVAGGAAVADPTIQSDAVEGRKRHRVLAVVKFYENAMKCQICCHGGREVQAASHCVKCDHLYMCQECTSTHARNTATNDHVVVPLMTEPSEEDQEDLCIKHHAPLTQYCSKCDEPACKICVQLDHGNHELQALSDAIQSKAKEVKVALGERESLVKRWKDYQHLMTKLETAASLLPVDKPDTLMKEIEDHSEKFISHIIKLKEELKAEIKARFEAGEEVRNDVSAALAAVSETIGELQQPFTAATELLSATEHPTSTYLDQLAKAQSGLVAPVPAYDDTDGKTYQERIVTLLTRNQIFTPAELPNLGKLKEKLQVPKFPPSQIFLHEMPADANDKFIPCVAIFGNKYAIAHPGNKRSPTVAVDIYELPNKLKLTLKDDIGGPVYDMSSTPDSKLAVLSGCNDGPSNCSVTVFNPNTGKITSSCNFNLRKPLSLGVNFQNQFVILSEKGPGQKRITFVNGNGGIELIHELTVVSPDENPTRVTCGFRYIFVMGQKEIVVYEVKDKQLIQLSNIRKYVDVPMDISATLLDHLFLADVPRNVYMIQCIEHRTGQWHNEFTSVASLSTAKESRISSNGHYTIMSWGQTFSLYRHKPLEYQRDRRAAEPFYIGLF